MMRSLHTSRTATLKGPDFVLERSQLLGNLLDVLLVCFRFSFLCARMKQRFS